MWNDHLSYTYNIYEKKYGIINYDLNNYDCLVQNDRTRCELVGSHRTNFNSIFNIDIDEEHVESVWHRRTSIYPRILICKIFNIEDTERGGNPGKYNTI